MKRQRKTRAELLRELDELRGQLAHVYHFAGKELEKTSTKHLMASGALVTITVLGGRYAVTPFVVRDGFSEETIAALKADMHRSYELAIAFRPDVPPQGGH